MTLFSLENYDDGSLMNFRVLLLGDNDQDQVQGVPQVGFEVEDDRGTIYVRRGGSCGTGPSANQWRALYRYAPAIDPFARQLRLSVNELYWRRFDKGEGGLISGVPRRGRWVFTVILNPLRL